MMGRGGVIYSGSLDMRPRGRGRTFQAASGPFRALVVGSYVMGDPDEGVDPSNGASPRIVRARVECDVILVKTGLLINRVPVVSSWGLVDGEPWVPKAATRTLSDNQPLNLSGPFGRRGEYQGQATPLDDTDGDLVLVDFIEGDPLYPMVTGPMPHPRSKRPMVEGDGWDEANGGSERGTPQSNERYIRFAGFEFRVNANGDVLMDTVGATSNDDTEDPADGSGHIRFRVKENRRLTVEMDGTDVLEIWNDGGQVRIDLGEGATQRLILGDDFRAFLNDWLSTVFEGHQHEIGTLASTSGTLSGQTGSVAATAVPPEVPPVTYLGTNMDEDLLSDLSRTKKS